MYNNNYIYDLMFFYFNFTFFLYLFLHRDILALTRTIILIPTLIPRIIPTMLLTLTLTLTLAWTLTMTQILVLSRSPNFNHGREPQQ